MCVWSKFGPNIYIQICLYLSLGGVYIYLWARTDHVGASPVERKHASQVWIFQLGWKKIPTKV
jgi:hypothetical protein